MELSLQSGGVIDVSEKVFGAKYNESLVHQAVVAYLAAARAGTHAQKSRSEVSGGGSKPWRQKGTGRARSGSIRSPIWRSGGVTFAAKPKSYAQKLNKKMYRGALLSIFSELARQQRLQIVETIDISEPKTKSLVAYLSSVNLDDVLIVTENVEQNLALASRNLQKVGFTDVTSINPVDLIGFKNVLMTVSALKKIEERFV